MKNNLVIYDTFLDWVEKYGPIVRINGLHNVIILVITPEGVKEFLMSPKYTKDKFYKRIDTLFGVRFMGKGLVTDRDYSHWHKQRRIMDPAFSRTLLGSVVSCKMPPSYQDSEQAGKPRSYLEVVHTSDVLNSETTCTDIVICLHSLSSYLIGLMGTFNEKAENLIEKITEKADGKSEVGMYDMLSRVTLDVIAKVAFGMELNSLYDDQTPFPCAISMVMKGVVETRNPLVQYIPGKQALIKEVRESIKLLRNTGRECIERRKQAMEDGEDIPKDILTQILKGAELEDGCNLEDLIDNFITFFIAGQETTANQLSFAVMELTRNPEIMAKLQAEVDEVVGCKRDIEYEDLGKLQYLSQVLKETLRLYPAAPGTTRALEEDIVIEGIKIPAKATLMFNSYIMGRMEQYFPDPFIFNPDRFHHDAPKPSYSYFPFSLGPRSCIGQVFSQMEAKVVMAKLVQRFKFELVEGQSFRILDTGTLRPLDGVICRLRPRTNQKAS